MPFRHTPPVFLQKGYTCWAYALASFKSASLNETYWPEDILRNYQQYCLRDGSLDPFQWDLVANEEKMRYKFIFGSQIEKGSIRNALEGYYIFAVEDKGGNWSHSYMIYGVAGYYDPYLAIMDPQKGLSWRYFTDISQSNLMLAGYWRDGFW